jgi:hypothetical protein
MQTYEFAANKSATSVCRNCCFYQPQGHNGGSCQQLNVSVGGSWPTCQLGLPAFAHSWQVLEDLPVQEQETTVRKEVQAAQVPMKLEVAETSNKN